MIKNRIQWVGLYTLVKREVFRMFRIASQVFLPPVITTALYFLIFGALMGPRIGLIEGVQYVSFICPGLILMSVITNAYGNVSSSVFSMRFQRSIDEILVSPMKPMIMVLGYVMGGVIRGFIVALLVFLVSLCFLSFHITHVILTILVVVLVSTVFSLAGFINAMLARNFDDIMIIPTFVLTPLTYLGGVFYSIHMLPQGFQFISRFNPIFYMVDMMRYAMLGHALVDFVWSFFVVSFCAIILAGFVFYMLTSGTGLRD